MPANVSTSQRRTGAKELCERERQATLTRGHARLDLAPHGALHGALGCSPHAPAPLVTGPPTCTSGVSRLGAGVRIGAGGWVEAVGVEESVPVAVGVGRGNGCNEGHGGLVGEEIETMSAPEQSIPRRIYVVTKLKGGLSGLSDSWRQSIAYVSLSNSTLRIELHCSSQLLRELRLLTLPFSVSEVKRSAELRCLSFVVFSYLRHTFRW